MKILQATFLFPENEEKHKIDRKARKYLLIHPQLLDIVMEWIAGLGLKPFGIHE